MAWVAWKDDGMPACKNKMFSAGIGPLTLRDALRLHINEPGGDAADLRPVAGGDRSAWPAFLMLDRLARAALILWGAGGRARVAVRVVVATAAAYLWAPFYSLFYWDHQFFDRYILYLLPFALIAVMATPGMAANPRPWRTATAMTCLSDLRRHFAVAGTPAFTLDRALVASWSIWC